MSEKISYIESGEVFCIPGRTLTINLSDEFLSYIKEMQDHIKELEVRLDYLKRETDRLWDEKVDRYD